jgi:DNA mismatch repair protein MSH2
VFNRSGFFSVHGDDAAFVARAFYKTTTVVKFLGHGDSALPGVTLNKTLFVEVLRNLLVDGAEQRCVELYEEIPRQGWQLQKQASPGKLGAFEDDLFRGGNEMGDTPIVAAVRVVFKQEQRVVGVAYVNPTTRELGACEFVDDEQFCTLEAVLCQLGAKECVLPVEPTTTPDGRRLRDVVTRCGALATERKATDFDSRDVEDDLARLLSKRDDSDATKPQAVPDVGAAVSAGAAGVERHRALLEKKNAAAALAAALKFSELISDPANHGRCCLVMHDTGRYMRLDSSALRALNVLPERSSAASANAAPAEGSAAAGFSLYGLLNKCRSPKGRRLLLRWLKQPLVDGKEITGRHDCVEAFVNDPEVRDTLRGAHLRALPDIERVVRKLERRKASLMDLCRLYQASAALPYIAEALERLTGTHGEAIRTKYAVTLQKLHDAEHLGRFESLLESAVDLAKIPDEYVICAAYDAELGALQALKDTAETEIQSAFKEAAEDLKMSPDKELKLEHNNMHGWFLRLTKKDETKARKRLAAAYQILEAKKDGTKFTCKKLRALSQKRVDLDKSYEQQQKHLVDRVVDVAASFSDVFLQASSICAEIDVLASFAEVAVSAPIPFVRPEIVSSSGDDGDDNGAIILTNSRHPNVEAQDGATFIPNTCSLEKTKSWFQIITGPNMGGKSTFIRQVGVCVLMAQVGSFVPCDSAKIAIRDAIFARVGAGDCQLRGISTFMAEMLETAAILTAATPRSLIIIDELGRGTSTYDGFGLAWAISEHIVTEVKAPCLFATHFHELTSLKGPGGVANFHVEAKIDNVSRKLTMLYRLLPGACDQSFGIHCAEFARFPEEVLEMARAKAAELEDFTEQGAVAGALGVGEKRPRDFPDETAVDVARGAARARQFLADFAALPLPEMAPEDAMRRVAQMKKELEADAVDSKWLTEVLAR